MKKPFTKGHLKKLLMANGYILMCSQKRIGNRKQQLVIFFTEKCTIYSKGLKILIYMLSNFIWLYWKIRVRKEIKRASSLNRLHLTFHHLTSPSQKKLSLKPGY